MNDQLITLKTAKSAKGIGFNQRTKYVWIDQPDFGTKCRKINISLDITPYEYNCPTQSLLQKYLREKHGYHIVIIPTITSNWTFKIVKVISEADNDYISGIKSVSDMPPYKEVNGYDYSTYEDALEEGLYEALKLLE